MMTFSYWLRRLPVMLALAAAAVVVLGPALVLTARAALENNLIWPEIQMLVFPHGRRLALLYNSILLALSSAAACMLLSWVAGSFFWCKARKYPALAAPAAVFIWFMALLPPFVHSYAWMALLGGELRLSGMAASWWTQTMAWLPLCLSAALFGFRCVEPELVEAARLVASPLRVLLYVVTPLVAPALLAGGALVFLLCLQEYGIPSLYQVGTYSLDIFADYSAHGQPARALLLSLPLLALSGAALCAVMPWFRQASMLAPRPGRRQPPPLLLPTWFRFLQGGGLLLVVLQALLPLLVLARAVGTWERLLASVLAAAPEIFFSIQTALLSALVAAGGILVMDAAVGGGEALVLPLLAYSLCLPATLTGIGFIALGNDFLGGLLYNSDWMPVAAAVSRFGPLAWLIGVAQKRRQNPLLCEAARFYRVSAWQRWSCIRLPLLLPGLTAAGMTVFLLSMGELSATLLVLPPGRNTLAVKTYNLLHYGASDAVAGLCLFLVAAGWLAGLVTLAAAASRRR